MRTLIVQTRMAIQANLYYVALMSALSIPDMAAALESEDGRATGKRYADWYEEWARPKFFESRDRENSFSGKACYGFRCALLHQGRSQRDGDNYRHIMFIEPGYKNFSLHYCVVGGEALLIQANEFIEEILHGCEAWLEAVEGTDIYKRNYNQFARRRPEGLSPYVVGVPVIG